MKLDKKLPRILRGLQWAVAIIVLMELLLSFIYPYLALESSIAAVQAKVKLARRFPQNAALLLLGDSSTGNGLNAKALTEHTGLLTLNLAPIAPALFPGNLKILSDYLSHHAAPRAIILGVGYDYWQRDLVIHDPWPPASSPSTCLDFLFRVWGLQTFSFLDNALSVPWNHAFYFFLPSQKLRGEWKRLLTQPLGLTVRRLRQRRQAEQMLIANQGEWRAMFNGSNQLPSVSSREKMIRQDATEHLEWMKRHSFAATKLSTRYLDKIIQLAKREQIQVMMLFPPLWEGVQSSDPAVLQFFKNYDVFMSRLKENYPDLIFLNSQLVRVPARDLETTVEHLTLERSLLWSRTVGQEVLKHLPVQPRLSSYEA